MKLTLNHPPREFEVGFEKRIKLKDCAHIELEANEQVTFFTESGAEYDVTRKSWGFYATPSLNGRLVRFNLRAVLVKNQLNQYFILLVEQGHEQDFEAYVRSEPLTVVIWLDDSAGLQSLE